MSLLPSPAPDLSKITLLSGSHETREAGVCAMELVAWMAGEKHTDRPVCVSPVLAAFLRRWNDDLDDEGRQRLKPFLPRTIGTASDGHDELRGWLLTDWMVRVHTPAWLELAGVTEPAAALRALPQIRAIADLTAAQPALDAARGKAAAAWDAAWDAARDAAGGAAWDAAGAAARGAARDAAGDAAWAAAWAAARDAAGGAARDAARERLEPTKVSLQASAFELLDRLIDPSAKLAASGDDAAEAGKWVRT